MLANELIEKLKSKIEETDNIRENTESSQLKLIKESNEFNNVIKEFNNIDQFQKNIYLEGYVKIQKINTRIEDSNANISKIKDKLKFIMNKLEKNNINKISIEK